MNPLTQVLTISEASTLWNLDSSTLRWAIKRGRFKPGEVRKAGREWLILVTAMERVYGTLKEEVEMLNKFDWDVIVEYMDDEIREQVHSELAPCTNEEFLNRYAELHKEQFGEEFQIN